MRRNSRFFFLPDSGRRIRAHNAGESVRATKVEISTDTAIVMVNCR